MVTLSEIQLREDLAVVKSSNLGDWTQRLRFIDWFGILMSMLALIM